MHSPGNLSTRAIERGICGMCWACNETFWRLCGKALMCTEAWDRADQWSGGAREIEFPARKSPPSRICFQLVHRPFQMPMCALGSSHPSHDTVRQTRLPAFYRLGNQGLWSSAKPASVIEHLRERQAGTGDLEPTFKESGRGKKKCPRTAGSETTWAGVESHLCCFPLFSLC